MKSTLHLEILDDPQSAARRAAAIIAAEANAAVESHGKFVLAVSGGRTPDMMLRALAEQGLPWSRVHLFQVDERILPDGDSGRNLVGLRGNLLKNVPIPESQIHPMPVGSPDLNPAAKEYAESIRSVVGRPSVFDLVHLGLGADGHTASLVPSDPVLNVIENDVAVTAPYQNARRMTLTYPVLNRSRRVLWLVTGNEKADMLARLVNGDSSIPAGRVARDNAVVLADRAAARSIEQHRS